MIREAIEQTTSDYEKEKLQERLAKIAGGVAVIKASAVPLPLSLSLSIYIYLYIYLSLSLSLFPSPFYSLSFPSPLKSVPHPLVA